MDSIPLQMRKLQAQQVYLPQTPCLFHNTITQAVRLPPSRPSQSWPYWHFGCPIILCYRGAVWCTAGCLATSLATRPPRCDHQKCIQTLPNMPWGRFTPPWVENHCLRWSCPFTQCHSLWEDFPVPVPRLALRTQCQISQRPCLTRGMPAWSMSGDKCFCKSAWWQN